VKTLAGAAILCRTTGTNGRTIGIAEAGHLTAERLIALLASVEGVTELVTHPGVGVSGYAHWRYAWDAETAALCDARVRTAIEERGIMLVAPSVVTFARPCALNSRDGVQ